MDPCAHRLVCSVGAFLLDQSGSKDVALVVSSLEDCAPQWRRELAVSKLATRVLCVLLDVLEVDGPYDARAQAQYDSIYDVFLSSLALDPNEGGKLVPEAFLERLLVERVPFPDDKHALTRLARQVAYIDVHLRFGQRLPHGAVDGLIASLSDVATANAPARGISPYLAAILVDLAPRIRDHAAQSDALAGEMIRGLAERSLESVMAILDLTDEEDQLMRETGIASVTRNTWMGLTF